MQLGDTVESLPNTLLTHDFLDDLAEDDGIEETIPVVSSDPKASGTLVTRQFILRFESSGYILVYAEERGWVVQERATEDAIPEIPSEVEAEEEIPYDDLCKGLLYRSQVDGMKIPNTDDTAE